MSWLSWIPFVRRRERHSVAPGPPPTAGQLQSENNKKNLKWTWKGLAIWFLAAIGGIAGYALTQPTWTGALSLVSTGVLLAASSAAVGGLLGFLFGIPRSLQGDQPAAITVPVVPGVASPSGTPAGTTLAPPPQPPRLAQAAARGARLGVNTNLEQISDWLTKILVGVGLTNLESFGPKLWNVAGVAAPALGGSQTIALLGMISFSVWGFFAAYLLTRLFLAVAFVDADDAASRGSLELHEQVAFQLAQEGSHETAAQQYAIAMRLTQTPEERRRLAEGFVYNALYTPTALDEGIRVAREYLRRPANLPSGRLWAYLAAGLGQQYKLALERSAPQDELLALEKEALTAVREAIRLDPAMKTLLRSLWDPNDPNRAAPDEDDLEVFRERPGFAELLN